MSSATGAARASVIAVRRRSVPGAGVSTISKSWASSRRSAASKYRAKPDRLGLGHVAQVRSALAPDRHGIDLHARIVGEVRVGSDVEVGG